MQLIKKVEVHYLRSIYSTVLEATGDLNLFFGRNDSGKSNILRALNLFFNDETDPGSKFDFDLDMSDLRKKKAAEAKGRQFVWVKITFNVPENYQKSLGREISVKKQWNRYGGDVNFSSSPSLSGGKASILTRFINQIDFTYIPAIKDLEVYADLIERMYSSASENREMLNATNSFIRAIGEQTVTLTEQLVSIFGGKASLAAPADMAVLFRNLDFAHGDDGHSLFKQKGDGIKARHLPELLRFINENESGKKFYLWGFEEPENSLDLSAATIEAKRFVDFSSRSDTQIFISSHSPAFYLAPDSDGSVTRRYFVDKQIEDDDGEIKPERATSRIDKPEEADRVMRAAGLMQLPYVIQALSEQRAALDESEKQLDLLKKQLIDLAKPTLFIEGRHDLKSYPQLLDKFGFSGSFDVKQLAGTPNSAKEFISSVASSGGLSPSSKVLFLFDNDKSGRSSLKVLAGNGADCSGVANAMGENLSAAVLPFSTARFINFKNKCGLSDLEIKFPFELFFVNDELLDFLKVATSDNTDWLQCTHNDYYRLPQEKTNIMRSFQPGSDGWVFSRTIPDNLKRRYNKLAMKSIDVNCPAINQCVDIIQSSLEL